MDPYEYILGALTVWREAANQPLDGKRAVYHVIQNRAKDARWPDTISGVVLQKLQFSCYNVGDPVAYKMPRPDDPSWEESRSVVSDPGEDLTHGANHYHTVGLTYRATTIPKWADPNKITVRIADHIFYKL